MGRKGSAITLIAPEDAAKWRQLERDLGRALPRTAWRDEYAANPPEIAAPVALPARQAPRRSGAGAPPAGDRRPAAQRQPGRPMQPGRPAMPGSRPAPPAGSSIRPATPVGSNIRPAQPVQPGRPAQAFGQASGIRPAQPVQRPHEAHAPQGQPGARRRRPRRPQAVGV
jgi:hypothetical protein